MDFVDYYYFCTVTGICNRTRDQERNETKDQKQFRTTTNESFLFSLSLLLPYSILFPLSLSISTKNSLPSLPIVPFVHEKMRWKNPCTAVRDAWPERRCCSCRFKFSFSVCKLINETLIFLPPRVTSLFSPHVLKNETLYTFFFFFLSENEAMNVHRGLANDGGMEFFRIIWIHSSRTREQVRKRACRWSWIIEIPLLSISSQYNPRTIQYRSLQNLSRHAQYFDSKMCKKSGNTNFLFFFFFFSFFLM